MSTVFMPGQFSGQIFEILGGEVAAARRRGGWLNSWQNRLRMEKWLDEQRQIAERAARRGKRDPEPSADEDVLASILVPTELETRRFGKERVAGLHGPLKFILQDS